MPLHPAFADKLHLLEGMPSSFELALADAELAARVMQFMTMETATPPPAVAVADHLVDGPHGTVPVRIYSPNGHRATGRPGLVWVHGGGFRWGSVDDLGSDRICRDICAAADAVVISVDYRLAVDGVTYPVPHDDVVAALRWIRQSTDEWGIDPDRLTLGGDSAGGNLAAGAALRTRDEDDWTPAGLALMYPVLHPVVPPLSPGLTAAMAAVPDLLRFLPADVTEMNRNYLGGHENTADGYSMPGLAVLDGLCPTLIINAEYDDLRASGEAFAAQLATAGVDVQQVMAPGMLHAFLLQPDTVSPAASARELLAALVARAGTGSPPR